MTSNQWSAYRYTGDAFEELEEYFLADKTIMEIINGPYIIRFNLPKHGRVYFVGMHDEIYHHLTQQAKTVEWLCHFFEGMRQDLVQRGFPANLNICGWTLQTLWNHRAALQVFPEAKVEFKPGAESNKALLSEPSFDTKSAHAAKKDHSETLGAKEGHKESPRNLSKRSRD